MNYAQVRLAEISTEGPQAGRFSFSFEPNVAELARSIKAVGLVNPPSLRRSKNSFEVICGYTRVLACKQNGITEIPALVYTTDEVSDEKCLCLSLIDNEWSGRMSPVEQAIALVKFSEQGYDPNRLAKEIAPRLGLPTSRQYVENCLRLLLLDAEILHAVHDSAFGIEQAFCLHNLEADSRLPIFHILRSCRANVNETREIISLIRDVAAMKDVTIRSFLDSELAPIIGDEALPPRKKLERFRTLLVSLRYPRLSETEARFDAIASEIDLGECCRIIPPKYFEGDDISIAIKAGSPEQLAQTLRKLSSPDTHDKFVRAFLIIKGCEES